MHDVIYFTRLWMHINLGMGFHHCFNIHGLSDLFVPYYYKLFYSFTYASNSRFDI